MAFVGFGAGGDLGRYRGGVVVSADRGGVRLARVKADDLVATEAQELLTGWDDDLTPDSPPGALFEVW